MVNKTLGGKAGKKALDGPLFKMKLHHFIGHNDWVFKDDRTNRRGPAPFPQLLIAWAGYPETVHGFSPGRIGPFTLVHSREDALITIDIARGSLQWIRTEDLKGAGDR